MVPAKTARPPADLLGKYCGEQPDRAEARAGNHICQPVHTEVDARPTDSDEQQGRENDRKDLDVQLMLTADDQVRECAQDDSRTRGMATGKSVPMRPLDRLRQERTARV